MKLVGRREDGDTLVEVILAIALMSLVLVGAFNIMGASYRTAMLSKERIEAVSYAQQQAERLRAVRDARMSGETYTPFNPDYFPQSGEILNDNLEPITCGGTSCKKGIYTINLQEISNPSGVANSLMRTYSIKVTWTQSGTSTTNESEIIFKLADRSAKNIKRDCAVVESCT